MKHVAIYMRVSTSQQDTKSQEPDLRKWADGQSEPVIWYRDVKSGKSMNRPAWNRLMDDLHAGKVSSVVCWRLDRLGRTAKGLTALFQDLIDRKVNLVSMREGVNLDTIAGRMVANIIASISQYETELRGERVLAGQAAARRLGKTWGGSEKGRTIKGGLTDEQVSMIHRLHREGTSIASIARTVNVSRPTVYAHLPTDATAAA